MMLIAACTDAALARFRHELDHARDSDPYAWRDSPVDPMIIRSILARLDAAEAEVARLREVVEAGKVVSKTLVELSLACEVYFDTDAELPDHDMIDGDLVHAYRDQNNWRDALAAVAAPPDPKEPSGA